MRNWIRTSNLSLHHGNGYFNLHLHHSTNFVPQPITPLSARHGSKLYFQLRFFIFLFSGGPIYISQSAFHKMGQYGRPNYFPWKVTILLPNMQVRRPFLSLWKTHLVSQWLHAYPFHYVYNFGSKIDIHFAFSMTYRTTFPSIY